MKRRKAKLNYAKAKMKRRHHKNMPLIEKFIIDESQKYKHPNFCAVVGDYNDLRIFSLVRPIAGSRYGLS